MSLYVTLGVAVFAKLAPETLSPAEIYPASSTVTLPWVYVLSDALTEPAISTTFVDFILEMLTVL